MHHDARLIVIGRFHRLTSALLIYNFMSVPEIPKLKRHPEYYFDDGNITFLVSYKTCRTLSLTNWG
jgi:hypothetical protein